MPFYEYECKSENCDHRFERRQGINDNPLVTCPKCGEKTLARVFHTSAIIFKGSGFYTTDYKNKK